MKSITLTFNPPATPPGAKEAADYRKNLSTLAFAGGGKVLFFGGDETILESPTIEMLRRNDAGNFDRHTPLKVSDFINSLPDPTSKDGRVAEIDIEGLANDGGYLWLIGSHSTNRKRPKPEGGDSTDKSLKRLAEIEQGANRFFLGRIPLKEDGEDAALLKSDGSRKAGVLSEHGPNGRLLGALIADEHFGPFVATFKNTKGDLVRLPSKDNGLDIEGLAVSGDRDFVGLRGPVLRGWACVLELKVQDVGNDGAFTLVDFGKRPYCKHFLQLDGLEIRDLEWDGDDLLILAGPTMALDGPARVFRWTGVRKTQNCADTLTAQGAGSLERILGIPVGEGCDHPEGIALIPGAKRKRLLTIYDSPAATRLINNTDVTADAFGVG